jgi:photosystem II stability/assembly factor-like uncharacterized protein
MFGLGVAVNNAPGLTAAVLLALIFYSSPVPAQQTCADLKAEIASLQQSLTSDQAQLDNCNNHPGSCTQGVINSWQLAISNLKREIMADQAKLPSLCSPPPPPDVDHVSLQGMDVVQVMGGTSVPARLIANKPTWVRVYFDKTNGTRTISATLQASRDGNTVNIAPDAAVTVDASDSLQTRRAQWKKSLNFSIPSAMSTVGTTVFTVTLLMDPSSPQTNIICATCGTPKQVSFFKPGPSRFAASWQEVTKQPFLGINPLGGRETMSGQVSAIAVDLVHDPTGNLVYVGSSSGGVWKSTNGLSANPKLVPLSDQSQSLSVGALALDTRTNPPTIYVGTGVPDNSSNIAGYTGIGILSTKDNGATWTKVDTADGGMHSFVGLGFSSIIVDPVNPDILLAATGMANDPNHPHASIPQGDPGFDNLGIYRSTDAGKTWSLIKSAKYQTQPSGSCFGAPDVLTPMGFFHIELIYEPTQATYFAGITGVGLFASSDQGATWTSFADLGLGLGLPAGTDIFKVSMASRNSELWAFLLTNSPDPCSFMLMHSTNAGHNWNQVMMPGNSVSLFKGALMYVAAPPGSRLLLAATQWLSAIDTLKINPSWKDISQNLHGDQHAIAFANANSWYVGDDGGAWATTDSGNTWTSLNADLHTLEFLSADENQDGTFAGGLQDNGPILTSIGPGWQQLRGGDGTYVEADPLNSTAFFMSNQCGNIFYVHTIGSAISPVANFCLNGLGSDFMGPFELLTAGGTSPVRSGLIGDAATIARNGRILLAGSVDPWLIAFDPGTTSNPCQPAPPPPAPAPDGCNSSLTSNPQAVQLTTGINQLIQYIAPVPGDPTTAWMVAGSSLFQLSGISFAGKTTLTQITTLPGKGLVLGHLAAASADTLYISVVGFLDGQKVFKSTDAGKKWDNISGNLPNVPVNWITLDPLHPGTIFLATNTGVVWTDDGGVPGEQWRNVAAGVPNVPVTQVKIVPGGQLLAATYGRNAWILHDRCQTLRDQLETVDCDRVRTRSCQTRLKRLEEQLKACEREN